MRKTMCACTETGIMKGTAKMKKAVNFISKKVDTVKDKVEATAIAAYLGLSATMPGKVFCSGGFLDGSMDEITVNTDVEAQDIMNRLLAIIAGLFVLVGIIKTGTSIFSILEAYSEDNSAAVNKAVKQLGIGVAFIAAAALVAFLLS